MKLSSKITTAVTALATFSRLPGAVGASINPSRVKGNIVPKNLPNTDNMAGFNVIYPENDWAWEKADPKTSLFGLGLTNPAPQWLLNIVEATHWASFPIGFIIANYLFNHASEIAAAGTWGGSPNQVFFLMLANLCSLIGGGYFILTHAYEGWMISPFKNLLVLPENPTREQVDAIRVKNYNNAWLRSITYQILFSFQALGRAFYTMGVFGVKNWTKVLVFGTTLISWLGPRNPRLTLTRRVDGEDRPVLPLAISLALVFAVNMIVVLFACIKLFYPIWAKVGMNPTLAVVCSILPTLLEGAGGAIEGYFAESTFKQWQHVGALSVLLVGYVLMGYSYAKMVAVGETPEVKLPSVFNFLSRL